MSRLDKLLSRRLLEKPGGVVYIDTGGGRERRRVETRKGRGHMDRSIVFENAQTLNKFMTNERILYRVNDLTLELLWTAFPDKNEKSIPHAEGQRHVKSHRGSGTMEKIAKGVYPVMITPFTADNQVDWEAVPFGMYECPCPYKRLLTPKVLEAMAETGRFRFIKDTCCDAKLIAERVRLLNGRIQLFNANCATFLETLKDGADGFSGIMANYHPDLLVWLYQNYQKQPEKARELSSMMSVMSLVEGCGHPAAVKYHMNLIGIPMELKCRSIDAETHFGPLDRHAIDDLLVMEGVVREWLKH